MVGDYIAHRDRTHISESYAGYLTDELEGQIHLDPSYVAPSGSRLHRHRRLDHVRDAVSQPAHGPTLAHRDDVQGLRAIAVLTVIASHASSRSCRGGFVGVDVFFVISGFLISQLLFREVERSGRVSIPSFYARRARRILPAATLVTRRDRRGLGDLAERGRPARRSCKDAVWAVFFAANIHFAAVGTDYFAPGGAALAAAALLVAVGGGAVLPGLAGAAAGAWCCVAAAPGALPRRLVFAVLVLSDRRVVRVVGGQHGHRTRWRRTSRRWRGPGSSGSAR